MNELSPAVKLTLDLYNKGYYCSEALLRGFNTIYNLGFPEEHLKIASGFGSGLGGAGCSCGSVTSGVIVLGVIVGRNNKSESEEIVHRSSKKLHDEFRERNKVVCCRILTRNVEWKSKDHILLCAKYVQDTAEILESILLNDLYQYLPQGGNKSVPKKNYLKLGISAIWKKLKSANKMKN
ncbi:MAG: C-GCAxxG-C-C family (seleno)protein [Firmicutes bacterium]|nr:C-GCAxxG-C-C family (seleno)protein [Bacillota bacterium]